MLQAIVWCNQLVVKLAALLLDLPTVSGAVHGRRQTAQLLLRKHLGVRAADAVGPPEIGRGQNPWERVSDNSVDEMSSGSSSNGACQQPVHERLPDDSKAVHDALITLPQPGHQSSHRQVQWHQVLHMSAVISQASPHGHQPPLYCHHIQTSKVYVLRRQTIVFCSVVETGGIGSCQRRSRHRVCHWRYLLRALSHARASACTQMLAADSLSSHSTRGPCRLSVPPQSWRCKTEGKICMCSNVDRMGM